MSILNVHLFCLAVLNPGIREHVVGLLCFVTEEENLQQNAQAAIGDQNRARTGGRGKRGRFESLLVVMGG